MPRSIKKITKKSAFREEEVKDIYTHALDYAKQKQKQALSIVSGIVIFIIVAPGIFFFNQYESKKARAIEAEAYQYFNGEDLPSDMKEEERYKKALELFQKAYKIDSIGATQLAIGHCYLKLGDLDNAIREYGKFIDDYPDSYLIPVAYQAIASTYVKRGNPDKALDVIQDLSKFKGGVFKDTVLMKEAEIYENKGEKEEAQKKYEQIVNEYPESQWIAQARAKVKPDDNKKQTSDGKDTEKPAATVTPEEKSGSDDATQKAEEEKKQDKTDETDKHDTNNATTEEKPAPSVAPENKPESDDTTQKNEE